MTNTDAPAIIDPDHIPRIKRRTLHEEVVSRMRDMIIEGRLAPGTRINEGLVGQQLGVSRTPLREAIKTLAGEGLIEIIPAKGAIVKVFSDRDLYQILEALKAIEQTAGRLACKRATDAVLAAILATHEQMLEFYATFSRLDYFKLNQSIHTAIVKASGNDIMAELHTVLQSRIKRLRFVGNEQREKWANAVAEHDEIITALMARDGEKLAEALGKHMDRTYERVMSEV